MSLVRAQNGVEMGRCNRDDHDLIVRKHDAEAKVYCSNSVCMYAKRPHPTGKELNAGSAATV